MNSTSSYAVAGRTRSSEDLRPAVHDGERSPKATADRAAPCWDYLEDSETVLLNKPSSSTSNENLLEYPTVDSASTKSPDSHNATAIQGSAEPRKCWICYTDETEESPLHSEWRSPCPCALTAHEACLLDWLADLENPRSRKRNGGGAKMVCPQCKSEILVSRPRSYVVDMVRFMERLAGRLVLPGMVFTLAGTLWAGCCAHGVYSMYLVFGTDEARRIFERNADGPWSPGLNLGLPLIPLTLIFSRTRYAEGLLPAIPVLFFATHNPGPEGELDLWPPSAAMTFAALPYVKSFYGAFYDRMFGKLEQKWIAEVQPRAGEADTSENRQQDQGGGMGALAEVGNGQILMEFDLELQVGMGNEEDPQVIPAAPDQNQQADQPAIQQDQGHGGNNDQILGRRQGDLIHETNSLADTVLGALVFPAISASMGGILKLVLPRTWTTPSSLVEKGRPGLLQTRWGRSVLGGCIFVLLKDALLLYCRWKLAQTHRKRKILNYDRTKKPGRR